LDGDETLASRRKFPQAPSVIGIGLAFFGGIGVAGAAGADCYSSITGR
jgi:hypothetical protein